MTSPAAHGPAKWNAIEELFHDSLEVPSGERGEFLRRRCPDDAGVRGAVERLLEGHAAVEPVFVTPPEPAVRPAVPARLGRYRVVRLIASGGMGAVYEAEQDHPRRTVALKVLRAGLASPSLARRFEHEAQVLALLRHPGIAQVYEAETFDDGTGAVPYFAMELVPGARPITESARGLRVRERLELFLQVCDAVHHGHLRGIIHRDLKPGNILIDGAGRAKVIDFGIARVADTAGADSMHTLTGQLVGTVAYMSPEQCGGDPREVDTRSDVYSLGVILYELLSGRPPFEVGGVPLLEAARVVREQDPLPPGTIDRALRGDLQTIVLTAMERERSRRYQSVADLAADIRRYLADQTITARPATAFYQLRKFARRNRALCGGACVAFAGLIAGAAGVTWEAFRLAHQRDAAIKATALAGAEADAARRISECLQVAIASFNPRGGRNDGEAPATVLHANARAIASRLRDNPRVQAEYFTGLATAYSNMGLHDRARPLLESAIAIFGAETPPDTNRLASAMTMLGDACRLSGDKPEAERLYRSVLAGDPAGQDMGIRVAAGSSLSGLLTARAEFADARLIAERAVADARELADPAARLSAHLMLVRALEGGGAPTPARDRLHEAIAIAAGDAELTANAHAVLGGLEARQGRRDAAAAAFASASRAWFDAPPPPTTRAAGRARSIGAALVEARNYAGAERFYRDALRRYTDLVGPAHIDVAMLSKSLADLMVVTGRPAQAVPFFREAIAALRVAVGDEHPDVGTCLFQMARIAAAAGDAPALRALRADAIDLERTALALPPNHPHRSGTLLLRGLIDMSLGDLGSAEPALRECVRLRLQQPGPGQRVTVYAQTILGACLTRAGNLDEAGAILRESVPGVEAAYSMGSFMIDDARAVMAEYNAAVLAVGEPRPPTPP